MRIFKYEVEWTTYPSVVLPSGATILTVQMQGDNLRLWAMVDDKEATRGIVRLGLFATGQQLPDADLQYISTFQNRGLVFHVFEIVTQRENGGNGKSN